jgi:hypothetical protein
MALLFEQPSADSGRFRRRGNVFEFVRVPTRARIASVKPLRSGSCIPLLAES